MKKQHILAGFMLTAALLAVPQKDVQAQGGAKWSILGNSNVDSTSYLGTNVLLDLAFYTNSIQRAVLTKYGRFGIGISSPSVLFHISGGDALFEQNLAVSNLFNGWKPDSKRVLHVKWNGKHRQQSDN